MSENLNRSTPDFSKYDSMSIGELEEILRADAMGPERTNSDVDEILYVMEVLAKKRRQNGIAGKTALEAYQEFQQHYLPLMEGEDIESVPKRKATLIQFRRIVAVAASLVLVFSLAVSANAFGIKDIWNAVAKWAEETFSFSTGVEIGEPTPSDCLMYSSLSDALAELNMNISVPTWLPDGYTLSDILIDKNPQQETLIAVYSNCGTVLKFSVQSFFSEHPEQIEKSDDFSEVYTSSGIDYYLFSNLNQNRAVWIFDQYECYISGELEIETIKTIIDSIDEGD